MRWCNLLRFPLLLLEWLKGAKTKAFVVFCARVVPLFERDLVVSQVMMVSLFPLFETDILEQHDFPEPMCGASCSDHFFKIIFVLKAPAVSHIVHFQHQSLQMACEHMAKYQRCIISLHFNFI